MLDWAKGFYRLKVLKEPDWQKLNIQKIDYQNLYYYSTKSTSKKLKSLDEIQKY